MITPLDPSDYRDIVRRALEEDVGAGDITTDATVQSDQRARGVFVVKADCVLAGLDVALEAFRQLDRGIQVTLRRQDGERCRAGEDIGGLDGPARALLIGERTALNFLQRLSGIATRTRQFVDAAAGRIIVLDTRKTTPTLRALEKYAVRAGGGTNHRTGLFDAVLIKDNHVRLAGGVQAAIARVRARQAGPIEVEAQDMNQLDEALAAGAESVLVDNMSIDDIREAVARARGRAKVEISGGVTLDRIPELAATGADYVSAGALTHSAPAVDISFEIEPLVKRDVPRQTTPTPNTAGGVSAPACFRRVSRRRRGSLRWVPAIRCLWNSPGRWLRRGIGYGLSAIASSSSRRSDRPTMWRSTWPLAADTMGPSSWPTRRRRAAGAMAANWFSPPGSGLYVSIVLRPSDARRDSRRATSLLTLAAGLALAEAIEAATGLRADIKWPNDLLVGRRKLAGILAESASSDPGRIVLGYGVNVSARAYPPELGDRATSLETELGRPIDRAVVCVETLAAMSARYRRSARRPVRCYPRRLAQPRPGEPGRACDVEGTRQARNRV